MCLIALAWQHHPKYSLVVAANRDEFHKRDTAAADYWTDAPDTLAGRDLEQGGTWLGITRKGKFAGVTNARGTLVADKGAPSRGWLLRDFLVGEQTAKECASEIAAVVDKYAGFNLFLADPEALIYLSNVTEPVARKLPPGRYVLSNGHLDSNWPKMQRASEALDAALTENTVDHERLLEVLSDRTPALDAELPDTGMGQSMERMLSPIFITSPVYGTRCSTAITADYKGNTLFTERRFNAMGESMGESSYALEWPLPS